MELGVYFESLRTSTHMFGTSVTKRFLESAILLCLHYELQYQFSHGAHAVMDSVWIACRSREHWGSKLKRLRHGCLGNNERNSFEKC